MNILMIHNYYRQRGGEDVSAESEIDLLKEAGHHVGSYFAHNRDVSKTGLPGTAFRTVWSVRAYRDICGILSDTHYDVMHVQNFFPLISPSVFFAARKCGVPVVQSIRNYRLFCLNGCFFADNEPCERCFKKSFAWPGIRRRCYRGSVFGSIVVALMQWMHGRILKTWFRRVDRFVALSGFVGNKLVEAGIPPSKIAVKPNFVHPDPGCDARIPGKYFVYVGRLSPEKGAGTLLDAWERMEGSGHSLKIVGDGPLRGILEERDVENVEFLGFMDKGDVFDIVRGAVALVFPSEWYETFGRVAIEAYAVGTPVIASRIGAVRELVRDGETGFLFNPGDRSDLAEKMKEMISGGGRFRNECRLFYERNFSREIGLRDLEKLYAGVVGKRRGSAGSVRL